MDGIIGKLEGLGRKLKKNWITLAIGVHLFLLIGAYLGVIPFFRGIYNYGLYFATCGMMYTPTRGIKGFFETIRPQLFAAYGGHLMETYGLSMITYPFISFGMDAIDATKWGFFICYTVSFITLFVLFFKICQNKYIALIYMVLFYMHPVFRTESRMEPPVYLGILAIPVSLLTDYHLWEKYKDLNFAGKELRGCAWKAICRKLRGPHTSQLDGIAGLMPSQFVAGLLTACGQKVNFKPIAELFLVFIIRFYVVSFSWYIAIIGAALSCGFFIFLILLSGRKKAVIKLKKYVVYIIIPWALSLFCLLIMTPRGASAFSESDEFMNALSIDCVTLLVPSKEQIIANYLPYLPSETEANNNTVDTAFSFNIIKDGQIRPGNGNAWYLGYIVLFLALGAIVCQKTRCKEVIALGAMAFIFFLLSLGPGLKIGITLTNAEAAFYGRYSLPLDRDIFLFPWRFIFHIIPFSAMRAVSRWLYGTIFILLICSAYFTGYTAQKTSKGIWISFILLLIAVLEYMPGRMKDVIYYENTLEQLVEDTALEIEPIVNNEPNRLVICSYDYSTNAYAVPVIMSKLDKCVTYSGAGDKSRDIAEKYQPSCVLRCQRTADPDEIVENILEIDKKALAEYILMPYFDVSRAVYIWPADENVVARTKEIAEAVIEKIQGKYQVIKTEHYVLIKIT